MINVAAALILYRNSFLITRRTQRELRGTWEFPGGKIEANETAFDAVKREIAEELGIDIFPYQKLRSFIYPYPFGKVRLFLIKCSISKKARQGLATQSPVEYKWMYILNTADIDFAPLDKRIITFLLKDNSVISKKTRGPGFASMSPEKLNQITSKGSKKAQAGGKSHRWTKEEASRAGKIGGRKSKRRKNSLAL